MSDVSGGPGWWLASNGKWYAPELAPPPPPPPPQFSDASASSQRTTSTTQHRVAVRTQPNAETPTIATGTLPHMGSSTASATMPSNGAAPQRILTSDVSLGEGWWQGTDKKWYAPEVYPSDSPQGDGWWQAPDGKWYAPVFHPSYASRSASDVSLGEGWWQGTDKKWYAPEVYPSDSPQGDGWWQAPNGKWYAPVFHPDYSARNATPPPAQTQAGNGLAVAPPQRATNPASSHTSAQAVDTPARAVPAVQTSDASPPVTQAWTVLTTNGVLGLAQSSTEYAVYNQNSLLGTWPLTSEGYKYAVQTYEAHQQSPAHGAAYTATGYQDPERLELPTEPVVKSKTYASPMSYIGSTRRIVGWSSQLAKRSPAYAVLGWTLGISALLFMYVFLLFWYFVVFGLFGVLMIPYRLIRRSQRKNLHVQQTSLATQQAMLQQMAIQQQQIQRQQQGQCTPPPQAGQIPPPSAPSALPPPPS